MLDRLIQLDPTIFEQLGEDALLLLVSVEIHTLALNSAAARIKPEGTTLTKTGFCASRRCSHEASVGL